MKANQATTVYTPPQVEDQYKTPKPTIKATLCVFFQVTPPVVSHVSQLGPPDVHDDSPRDDKWEGTGRAPWCCVHSFLETFTRGQYTMCMICNIYI